MPYSDEEVADWAARAPEPIDLELPGWTKTCVDATTGCVLPNERLLRFVRGASSITITRFWDMPLHGGHPMHVTSSRPATIAGKTAEICRTDMFEGAAEEVDVVFLTGRDWQARVVFERCPPDVVDAACAAIRIAAR
jgi:hypothetical protein